MSDQYFNDEALSRELRRPLSSMDIIHGKYDHHKKINHLVGGTFGWQITFGTVIDANPATRSYQVQVSTSRGSVKIVCSDLSTMAPYDLLHLAPKRIGMHTPGTSVLVYRHIGANQSIILGAVPGEIQDIATNVCDIVGPFSNYHARADALHNYVFQLPNSGGLKNFANGRPMNIAPGSDEGWVNDLGCGLGISRMYTWMRGSEMSSLTCMYLDHLVRLCSYNFEHYHSGGERVIKDDEGEILDVEWSTPYPWESKGMMSPNVEAFVNTDQGNFTPSGTQNTFAPITNIDDADDGQQQAGIPRLVTFRGYLGDLEKSMVFVPDADKVNSPRRIGDDSTFTGVLDIQKHIDGAYSVRSARSIVHEKYIAIPAPSQMVLPEDNATVGDSTKNYRAAGAWGSAGPPHHKPIWDWSPEGINSQTTSQNWAAKVYDYHAWLFNYYGVTPFMRHVKDWKLPQEIGSANESANIGSSINQAIYDVNTSTLEAKFSLPLPKYAELKIDDRVGSARYYYSRSIMAQLEDGSILIEDGYGGSIHMTGGNIFMTCPGDIWNLPGRSFNAWGADDINLKAGNSCDITASNKDVRIKAENNFHALAGNNGATGGILLESRSALGYNTENGSSVGEDATSFGVSMISRKAPVAMYGGQVYIRSTKESGGNGMMIFDAARGEGKMITLSDQVLSYANSYFNVAGFVPGTGQTCDSGSISVNYFSKSYQILGADKALLSRAEYIVGTQGNIALKGFLVIGDAGVGRIFYPGAMGPEQDMSQLTNQLSVIDSQVTGNFYGQLCSAGTGLENVVYDTALGGDNGPASGHFGFTCRNEAQYGLGNGSGFTIVESRWQWMYRNASSSTNSWYEPAIQLGNGPKTMPHPGYENWQSSQKFTTYDPLNFDTEQKKNKDRENYEDTADSTKTSQLSSGYLISVTHS